MLHWFQRRYYDFLSWAGDVRRLSHLPYVTWDPAERRLDYSEVQEALTLVRAGDVGLHRLIGYLSNLAIPGFLTHAWIHVNSPIRAQVSSPDGSIKYLPCTTDVNIVEAISEGVVLRSSIYPMEDYAIILRPKNISEGDSDFAVKKALSIVGCNYDFDFKFDIEAELDRFHTNRAFSTDSRQRDREEVALVANNLAAGWDGGFSCSEVVAFAYWHVREQLGIHREKARGKMVVLPQSLMNHNYDIVWMSSLVTLDAARDLGLHEEGLSMIEQYQATHCTKDRAVPSLGEKGTLRSLGAKAQFSRKAHRLR